MADDLVEFLRGRYIVGHNVGFDLRFLRAEFCRLGLSLPTEPSTIDTNHWGRASLEELCREYSIAYVDSHTALGDARLTAQVLSKIFERSGTSLAQLIDTGQLFAPPPPDEWPPLEYQPTEYRRHSSSAPTIQATVLPDYRPGMSVCFTGSPTLTLGDKVLKRHDAQKLAMKHGFAVQSSVTKKLGLLVAEDPDSMSGKARKAREYEIPIVGSAAFWTSLGVAVESR